MFEVLPVVTNLELSLDGEPGNQLSRTTCNVSRYTLVLIAKTTTIQLEIKQYSKRYRLAFIGDRGNGEVKGVH